MNVHQKEDNSTGQVRVDTVDNDFAANVDDLNITQTLVGDCFVGLGVVTDTIFEVLLLLVS